MGEEEWKGVGRGIKRYGDRSCGTVKLVMNVVLVLLGGGTEKVK